MAWRRSGDKPLSKPMMVTLLTHICVIRHQWVNSIWWAKTSQNPQESQKLFIPWTPTNCLSKCWILVNRAKLGNKLQWTWWSLYRNTHAVFQENAFENVVCKTVGVLYWPYHHIDYALRVNCFRRKISYMYLQFIKFLHKQWTRTCGWNPPSCKTRTYLFYTVNVIGAVFWRRKEPRHQQPWFDYVELE